MSIIKSKHAGNFTVLPNEIFKQNLSLEAIGLLASLLKLPSDWVIQKSYLHIQLDMGRDKLDRVFKELHEKGFILSVKEYDDKGRFTYNHIVYDKPYNGEAVSEEPSAINPSTENPTTVKLQLQKKEILNKEILKKDNTKENNNNNKESIFSFDSFWNLYPNKVAKEKCKLKYNQLTEKERGEIQATIGEFLAHKPFATYTHPHPLTYLNQKRWQDEVKKPESKEIKWE